MRVRSAHQSENALWEPRLGRENAAPQGNSMAAPPSRARARSGPLFVAGKSESWVPESPTARCTRYCHNIRSKPEPPRFIYATAPDRESPSFTLGPSAEPQRDVDFALISKSSNIPLL
jgi:hypothetical protein